MLEKGRGSEGNIDLLLHPCMHSLVDSRLCLTGYWTPNLGELGWLLTSWATRQGQNFYLIAKIQSNEATFEVANCIRHSATTTHSPPHKRTTIKLDSNGPKFQLLLGCVTIFFSFYTNSGLANCISPLIPRTRHVHFWGAFCFDGMTSLLQRLEAERDGATCSGLRCLQWAPIHHFLVVTLVTFLCKMGMTIDMS